MHFKFGLLFTCAQVCEDFNMYFDVPLADCLDGIRTRRNDCEKIIRCSGLFLFVAFSMILTSSCSKRAVVKPSGGLESEAATAGSRVTVTEPDFEPISKPDPAIVVSSELKSDPAIAVSSEPKAFIEPSPTSLPGFKRPAKIKLDRRTMSNSSGGELLWSDRSLGTSGRTCDTCHRNDNLFAKQFSSPYPHRVALVHKNNDVDMVEVDEMVNFCIVNSLSGDLLPWNSDQLLMLSAHVLKRQIEFIENEKINQYKQ